MIWECPRNNRTGMFSEVEESVRRAFRRRSELDARQVMVAVSGGQVTLSGQTFSWTERERATFAAWRAMGVTGVDNHIKAADPVSSER